MYGKFITLEGVESSGKSTQWQLLGDYCKERNIPHILIREPGSTYLGEKIRSLLQHDSKAVISPLAEAYLFAASRAQLVLEVIKPSLQLGKLVICDRFIYSSLVYQGVGRALGVNTINEINLHALCGITPNITFFLDIPLNISLMRMNELPLDRIENESIDFHKSIYNGYTTLLNKNDDTIIRIDGTLQAQDIHNKIVTHLEEVL